MTTKINVKGPIVNGANKMIYNFLKMDSVSAKDVIDQLPTDGSDIQVDINSQGGMVDQGNEIYTALKSYSGNVTVNIVGLAASAASIIAMAGDTTRITPVGQLMIHNVSADVAGDYREHEKMSDVLKNMNSALASAYQDKTGLDLDVILQKMNDESFLTAEQAKELGFVDEIMFDSKDTADVGMVAVGGAGLLPESAIEKVQSLMNQKKSDLSDDDITRISDSVVKKLNVKPQKQAESTFNPFAF